ncbi:hypothetical protein SN811_04230 [Ligilactobacillus agilis]|uniref:Uncharacterized protein n=1 Tax=Ligilactobacillus agilis TaxID=1601 RepID=A0A6F9Y2Z1_9LACO|nr:hypothetical protein SN811_04230 [Ligilactobacillus agilis]
MEFLKLLNPFNINLLKGGYAFTILIALAFWQAFNCEGEWGL